MTRAAAEVFDSGEELAYRSVSSKAVLGLLLGLASAFALVHPVLWVVPALAIGISLWALRDIAQDANRLAGRGAAVAGLTLGLFFGTAAAGNYFARRAMAVAEARQTAEIWFQKLRLDEPHRAHQLSIPPDERFPSDEPDLWEAYRDVPKSSAELKAFVEQPTVRALLKLGDRATVRYYATEGYAPTSKALGVKMLFAVTTMDGERPRTFFVQLTAVRFTKPVAGQNPWYIADIQGGVRPPGW